LIYERTQRGLQPGYHQLPWDGRDAEGEKLANGIYFYKMLASSTAGDVVQQGRLVKLRRPNRAEPEEEVVAP
jgi:flagellar hook assembly protein FlgD